MDAVLRGKHRQEFFDRLRHNIANHEQAWQEFEDSEITSPSLAYSHIMLVLLQSAKETFTMSATQNPLEIEIKSQHKRLLQQRREHREKSFAYSQCLVHKVLHDWFPYAQLYRECLSHALGQWSYLARLEALTKKIKAIKEKHNRNRKENLRVELIDAWRTRQIALAWRLARMIAGCKKGPRRKWGSMVMTTKPTKKQWEEKLKKPDSEGGWQAIILDQSDVVEEFQDIDRDIIDNNITRDANADFKELRKQIKHAKCRKGVPQSDVPSEVWRLVFFPNEIKDKNRLGLGASMQHDFPGEFYGWIRHLLCTIRATSRTPIQFNTSQGHLVLKFRDAKLRAHQAESC